MAIDPANDTFTMTEAEYVEKHFLVRSKARCLATLVRRGDARGRSGACPVGGPGYCRCHSYPAAGLDHVVAFRRRGQRGVDRFVAFPYSAPSADAIEALAAKGIRVAVKPLAGWYGYQTYMVVYRRASGG